MKHKFTINIVQTVEVELDDEVVNDEYMEAFSEHMWQVSELSEIAEYIARHKALYDGYSVEFAPDWYKAEVVDEYAEEA